MRVLSILFVSSVLFWTACNSDNSSEQKVPLQQENTQQPAADEKSATAELLEQLSPATQQALSSGMQAQCACIKAHQTEVDNLMATLEPLSEGLAMGTIRDAGEAGMVYIQAMQQAESFNVCLVKTEGPESQQELMTAEKELDQLFAGLNENQQLDRLLEIYGEIAQRTCPEGARIIKQLHRLSQQIRRLQAN